MSAVRVGDVVSWRGPSGWVRRVCVLSLNPCTIRLPTTGEVVPVHPGTLQGKHRSGRQARERGSAHG